MWEIFVDTGGTFTDAIGLNPQKKLHRVKVLSNSSLRGTIGKIKNNEIWINESWEITAKFINTCFFHHFASSQKIVITNYDPLTQKVELEYPLNQLKEGDSFEIIFPVEAPILAAHLLTQTPITEKLPPLKMRLATTKGTNALLEKKGAKVILFITKGFKDLLKIGTQQRPNLFSLAIEKEPLPEMEIIEVNERIDAKGQVIAPINMQMLMGQIEQLKHQKNISIGISFLNSYTNPSHEIILENLLKEHNISFISRSTHLANTIKYLPRTETTVVDAYLNPILFQYLENVENHLNQSQLHIMTSAGGLISRNYFKAKDSLLSGPAGGVIGAGAIGIQTGFKKLIPFDMGGTSTDVSRFNGIHQMVRSHAVGSAKLISDAMKIETVAAGGGSICGYDNEKIFVGPESAGAYPGPACYGAGGPLTITDVNLLLGRLDIHNFNIPIFIHHAEQRLQIILDKINQNSLEKMGKENLLMGFLDIANERMANAIQKISISEGVALDDYTLLAFGGAGGQPICQIADKLKIKNILCPLHAGILSAYGLKESVITSHESKTILQPLSKISEQLPIEFNQLIKENNDILQRQGLNSNEIIIKSKKGHLRMIGQENTIPVEWSDAYQAEIDFKKIYTKIYGYFPKNKELEVESIQVISSSIPRPISKETFNNDSIFSPKHFTKAYFNHQWIEVPLIQRNQLGIGFAIQGPAIIQDHFSTTVIENGWRAIMGDQYTLLIEKDINQISIDQETPEMIQQELFLNRFKTMVDQMGLMLERTAISTNIKERLDLSCALLDQNANLIVNAPHIPVHLGALSYCVKKVLENHDLNQGDMIITNHPAFGGSHLPDVTIISPIFFNNEKLGYFVNRAHHAEIGGKCPGSMTPDSTKLEDEGVAIPPTYLFKNGIDQTEKIQDLFAKARYPSRRPKDNWADVNAQIAANRFGEQSLIELAENFGIKQVSHYMQTILQRSENALKKRLETIPQGSYHSEQLMDDNTLISVRLQVSNEKLIFDFSGSSPEHPGNLNATPAIVYSCVVYFLRLLIDDNIPLNDGLAKNIELIIPPSFLNPAFSDDPTLCPAVVSGNVETSQRIIDALLQTLKICANSQGTMNNFIFGNENHSYYETICGGEGASANHHGADAVHTHMTNTSITDPEILEHKFPVRLNEFSIRQNSGGIGKWNGGNGITRNITFLENMEISLLTQNRNEGAKGSEGGQSGKPGSQLVVHQDKTQKRLEWKANLKVSAGDSIIINTPGGGGFGSP